MGTEWLGRRSRSPQGHGFQINPNQEVNIAILDNTDKIEKTFYSMNQTTFQIREFLSSINEENLGKEQICIEINELSINFKLF